MSNPKKKLDIFYETFNGGEWTNKPDNVLMIWAMMPVIGAIIILIYFAVREKRIMEVIKRGDYSWRKQ